MLRQDIMAKLNGKAPQQAYTSEELARLYKVTVKTFLKWLTPFKNDIGEKIGWYFTIRQVSVIFDKLGHPEMD